MEIDINPLNKDGVDEMENIEMNLFVDDVI